jgi:hypothetical protein
MDMTEDEERVYLDGQNSSYRDIMALCVRALGYENATKESLMLEREEAIVALRSACEDAGDNDWDNNLYLADIINKHLYWSLK